MAEQLLDLHQGLGALRRHRLALAGTALLGAAVGVTLSTLQAPTYTSTSQVLLPQLEVSGQLANRDPATEVKIASSDLVLGAAAKALDPPMSRGRLDSYVSVSAPSQDVVEYTVTTGDADLAKSIAQAAAKAEVDYVQESGSSLSAAHRESLENRKKTLNETLSRVAAEYKTTHARIKTETGAQRAADETVQATLTGQMSDLAGRLDSIAEEEQGLTAYAGGEGSSSGARIIQPATEASPPDPVRKGAIYGLAGAGGFVLVLVLLLMLLAGRDKRLRMRDAIADACGSTVVATIRSRVPHTVTGWTGLLSGYKPGATDAWAIRQVLRRALDGSETTPRPTRLTMLTLDDDTAGLAVAIQTASYAAGTGLHTRLVPGRRQPSATALWAALRQADGAEPRPGLRVGSGGDPADLDVTLTVLDRKAPTLVGPGATDAAGSPDTTAVPPGPPPDAVVLVLSAGAATADELARAAIAADDAGAAIVGVVVVDPDQLDRTTGRLHQHERTDQPALPTRLTGISPLTIGTAHRNGVR